MENHVYELECDLEERHWWFSARHHKFLGILRACKVPLDASILDVGSSTGGTIRYLRKYGYNNVIGVDASYVAIEFASKKCIDIRFGDILNLPFPQNTFDFVFACDIIEHVENDVNATLEIYRVLKNDRYALFTVPAFEFLWSNQDEISGHKRRYTLNKFKSILNRTAFNLKKIYYFNFILFIPILFLRKLTILIGATIKNENTLFQNGLINKALYQIFKLDIELAKIINPPFGVSIAAIVKK